MMKSKPHAVKGTLGVAAGILIAAIALPPHGSFAPGSPGAAPAWAAGSDADATAAEHPEFITNARRLTYEGRRAGEGYFSPDDTKLIFSTERDPANPFFQIYVLDLTTGDSHRVSPGTGKTTCAYFSPDGERVLFSSTHLDPEAVEKQKEEIAFRAEGKEHRYSWDFDEYYDVFTARTDGSDLRRVTTALGYDAEASFSPDGKQIVFASNRHAYEPGALSEEEQERLGYDSAFFLDIYIMNADGSNVRRLTDEPGYDGGPFFTPDGERVVWRHFTGDMMLSDVHTVRTDGTDRRRLTDFGSMSWAPYFHPSGGYAIFTSNKLGFGNFELYIVDAEGTREPVRVSFEDGFDGLPIFSNGGDLLSWTSNRTENGLGQIFLADWNHELALEALEAAPLRTPATTEDRAEEAPKAEPPSSQSGSGPPPPDAGPAAAGDPELSPQITAADLSAHVSYLASDELEGRMTGSEGARKAADYIARRFEEAGLVPGGDDGTYFQAFEFTAGVNAAPGGNELEVAGGDLADRDFELDRDFRPLSFSSNGEIEGGLAFAGYGIVLPDENSYDSYAGLDVEDKVVLVLRYSPEDAEMERRQELNHYASLRYKALTARERGARALLVLTGPRSPSAGELAPLTFDTSLQGSGILAASISGEVGKALFEAAGKDLEEVQAELDRENPHFEGTFEIPDLRVSLRLELEREKKSCRNVVGLLPPSDGNDEAEYVVAGAHYDHIGHGEAGGSLAHKGEEGMIHNGADDNASGTAMVLELAAAAAQARGRGELGGRGMVFACWSGEEIGTIGSSHYLEAPAVPLERSVAYLNFDMVGRLRENRLNLQGTGSSDAWNGIIERRNVPAGFQVKLNQDPYLPTDATPFYLKKIPVLSFFTGSHEDYNRPTDDPATLNYEGMERIGRFARNVLTDVATREERPAYVEVERKRSESGARASLRAYTGTIPDYAADDVEGLRLAGVRAGGPADKAGLQEGDIVVHFAGVEIKNIYDYTFALGGVKVGEPVEIAVLREGERMALVIVPETRE
jgi:Tol biopolymer transport system component